MMKLKNEFIYRKGQALAKDEGRVKGQAIVLWAREVASRRVSMTKHKGRSACKIAFGTVKIDEGL